MDGRTAAINVFGGAMLGASVPFLCALALSQAMVEFRLIDHLFTLCFLCIACGAIGVVINLPWNASQPEAAGAASGFHDSFSAFHASTRSTHQKHAADFQHADDDETHHHTRDDHARPATKHYAMSRLAALRTLDLAHDASDDDVREAFRKLAKENHPDLVAADGPEAVAEATKKFVKLREAYEVLIDEA